MRKQDAIDLVIDVLATIQRISGRESQPIAPETCPIGELDQFDSLNGVEASAELSNRLGFDLPGVNVFVNDQGTKALTVAEVAASISRIAQET